MPIPPPEPQAPETPSAPRPAAGRYAAWRLVREVLRTLLSSTLLSLMLLLSLFLTGILFLDLRGTGPQATTGNTSADPPGGPATGPSQPLASAGEPGLASTTPIIPPLRRPAPVRPPSGRPDLENPFHITRGRDDRPNLSLTFDGSAYAGDLAEILTILRQEEVPATFFLSGEFIEAYPGATRAIAAAGHEVGSHLYRHIHLTTWEETRHHALRPEITHEYFHSLLRKNEEAYRQVTGLEMKRFWRAPYGETNPTLDAWASQLGYRHVAWTRNYRRNLSMDSLDWISQTDNPAT